MQLTRRVLLAEYRHNKAVLSKSQMRDRERSDRGSMQLTRRVLLNREPLLRAPVWVDLEDGDHSAQIEYIAVMRAANEILRHKFAVAAILSNYAQDLADRMVPLSEGRGVLQSQSAPGRRVYRGQDLRVITDYTRRLNEVIVDLDAEEQAAREGRAPEGENPEYQAWRTLKLRRLSEISKILDNVAKYLAEAANPEVGSSIGVKPLLPSSEVEDLVYLHWRLFSADAEDVSSYLDSTRTAANFFKLHDETLTRDLKQFRDANIRKKFGVWRLFNWTTSSCEPIRRDLPRAEKLLKLCVEKVQKAEQTLRKARKVEKEKEMKKVGGAVISHVMNSHHCDLLMQRLHETRDFLASIDQSQLLDVNPVLVLGELLQTLHDAQMLVEASCVTTKSRWARVAFEQGDTYHTFARLLYEIEWHSSVLFRMVTFFTSPFDGIISGYLIKNDGQLSVEVETALLRAMKRDTEGLKHRLRSVKVADSTEQGLVDQLLNRMEAPSSDLVFLNSRSVDPKGADFIGQGGYGVVVKTNFLGMECAMKVINGVRGTKAYRDFEKETNAVKKLGNHPHLVRLYCYSKTKNACCLIMEKLQTTLEDVLHRNKEKDIGLSLLEAVSLMLQIGEGVKHIHSKGAAHRDLKPGNILVNLAESSTKKPSRICSVKIADFGLTKTDAAVVTCAHHTRNTGTSAYMAPEVMKLSKNDPQMPGFNPSKADIYSFGVVCSAILSGKTPYGGHKSEEIMQQVKAGTLRPNLPPDCPARLTTLIKKCWAGDYAERPLLPEVCAELRYIKGLLLMYVDRGRHRIDVLESLCGSPGY